MKTVLAVLIVLLCAVQVQAGEMKRLERSGKVYSIAEPNIIDEMKQKAANNLVNLQKIKDEYLHYQPKELHKLPRAEADRTVAVDVTYVLDHDVVDQHGKVLYRKGFTFNPLDYSAFPGGLVVIDGSDRNQVEWFMKSPYARNRRAILLLSDGYAAMLKQELKRPVYYLTGRIATRLHLQAVPSIVVQAGRELTLREVKLEK